MLSQLTTAAWTTCGAPWDTRTCAERSKPWTWPRFCPSTPSRCRCSPLAWLGISLEQVNTHLTLSLLVKWTDLLFSVSNLSSWSHPGSWGMPAGRGRHVDPHHSWSSFSRSSPDCALGLPHREEEEPRRLPNHLRWLFTVMFPGGPERNTHDINHCFTRLNTPPCAPLSLHPSSVSVLFSALTSNTSHHHFVRLICAFWSDPLFHCLETVVNWGKTLYRYYVKSGMSIRGARESPQLVLYYLWFLWKEFWGIMGFEGTATLALLICFWVTIFSGLIQSKVCYYKGNISGCLTQPDWYSKGLTHFFIALALHLDQVGRF